MHNAHPVLNGTFQSIHRFYHVYSKLCAAKHGRIGSGNDGVCVYFWMIKDMNLQNDSIGRMVCHLMMYMYERGS